jgi:hypothetical protein
MSLSNVSEAKLALSDYAADRRELSSGTPVFGDERADAAAAGADRADDRPGIREPG